MSYCLSYNMLIKNCLILVVVMMSFENYHSIEAEVVRGVDIPRLDSSRISGKWYRLTYLKSRDIGLSSCSINIIERQSDDRFTVLIRRSFTSGPTEDNSQISNQPVDYVIHATIQKDSNVLVTVINDVVSATVVFDVEYDSHLAVYTAPTREQIFSGDDGFFFIYARQKIIPAEIVEKVRLSNFVQQGLKPGIELIMLDTTFVYCE